MGVEGDHSYRKLRVNLLRRRFDGYMYPSRIGHSPGPLVVVLSGKTVAQGLAEEIPHLGDRMLV